MDNSKPAKNVSMDDALKEGENVRISQTQIFQRGVDSRSGNTIVKDAQNRRIIFGALPDGNYGLVISKVGYDVIDQFS